MLYGQRKVWTQLLTVVVQISREEDDEGEVTLLDVQGNTTSPGEGRLSDVEWFRESWNCIGADMLWDRDDHPADGKYMVKGCIQGWYSNTPNSGEDYDETFEIESQTKL